METNHEKKIYWEARFERSSGNPGTESEQPENLMFATILLQAKQDVNKLQQPIAVVWNLCNPDAALIKLY